MVEGVVLVDLGGDWSGMICLLVVIFMVTKGQVTTLQSPSLSWLNMLQLNSFWNPTVCLASLWTRRTSAQWCLVDTSYLTHNWETCGKWEHLIPSCTGPKDLPTLRLFLIYFFYRNLKSILQTKVTPQVKKILTTNPTSGHCCFHNRRCLCASLLRS